MRDRLRLSRMKVPGRRLGAGFWGLLALGLVSYAGLLLAQWPASHAWSMAQRHLALPAELHVGPLEGTVWEGRATSISGAGIRADHLAWELRPTSLLAGRAVVDVRAGLDDGHAEGTITARTGEVAIDGLAGRLPARNLGPAASELSGEAVRLDGTITFAIERLRASYPPAPELITLEGRAGWHEAAVTVDHRVELGGVTTTLASEGGAATGMLDDTGGPLALDGTWRLAPDGAYTMEALVDTRAGAASALEQTLEMAGPRREEGIELRLEGRL